MIAKLLKFSHKVCLGKFHSDILCPETRGCSVPGGISFQNIVLLCHFCSTLTFQASAFFKEVM